MPYTSRHEITTTAEACIQDFISNGGNEQYAIYHASPLTLKNSIASPIMEKDTDNHLMTSLASGVSPPLDLFLIRPSGVNRLNNFLLWQVKGPNLNAVNNLSIFFLSTVKEHNYSSYPPSGQNLVSSTSFLSSWTITEKYGTVA